MANKQSLPWILDIEASGIHEDSYPIQVAWSNGLARHSCFVKPEPSWLQWDAIAEELHGIQRSFLLENGLAVQQVARIMNEQLYGRTLYSDAIQFDLAWCKRLFDAAGIDMGFEMADFWLLLVPYVPMHVRNQRDLAEWIESINDAVKSRLNGRREHQAADDVQSLLEMLRISREETLNG
ncbi:hypothetical protein [Mariprofundus ferrooxydans]|uniref:hypothetical protein n=1 Tax=Mariprofundus ferrooxydans TaxID=314344 RepID=UPI00035D981F|nr:hypothetical protein [Mariprofundus ferrooxydans]